MQELLRELDAQRARAERAEDAAAAARSELRALQGLRAEEDTLSARRGGGVRRRGPQRTGSALASQNFVFSRDARLRPGFARTPGGSLSTLQ